VPVVALLHDGELVDGPLPALPHDRPVSGVITPALGVVWLTRLDETGWMTHH
jgi:5-formyltetrahydrofolate cyclo-ligase